MKIAAEEIDQLLPVAGTDCTRVAVRLGCLWSYATFRDGDEKAMARFIRYERRRGAIVTLERGAWIR